MNDQKKWRCDGCDSIVDDNALLRAVNPFDNRLFVYGCPECKDVGGFTEICSETVRHGVDCRCVLCLSNQVVNSTRRR